MKFEARYHVLGQADTVLGSTGYYLCSHCIVLLVVLRDVVPLIFTVMGPLCCVESNLFPAIYSPLTGSLDVPLHE